MRGRVIIPMVFALSLAGLAASLGQAQPVAYEIVDGGIPQPLTDGPGNRFRGELVARDPTRASCLICHAMPIPDEPDPGNIGPDLAGVGSRFTAAELRLRLVDPKMINPETIMPAYYSLRGLNRVEAQYVGETIYTAQEVEDVVAFLLTLTEQ